MHEVCCHTWLARLSLDARQVSATTPHLSKEQVYLLFGERYRAIIVIIRVILWKPIYIVTPRSLSSFQLKITLVARINRPTNSPNSPLIHHVPQMGVSGIALITHRWRLGNWPRLRKDIRPRWRLRNRSARHQPRSPKAVKAEIEEQQCKAGATPCRVLTYPINITDENRVNEVVEEVATTFGRLDYVINAAGIAMKHTGGAAFCETSDWERI
jgi:Dehydrogenases with different specificities (related to short-chain alcohol dehydrogenases)